jgi:hypothetical protein
MITKFRTHIKQKETGYNYVYFNPVSRDTLQTTLVTSRNKMVCLFTNKQSM